MRELALNVLDIAENSLRAGAKLVQITLSADFAADTMSIAIEDDGCGMSEEMLASVCDPFTTTRTTRKVGLGIPMLKQSAEMAGGTFGIESEIGKGTWIHASFDLSNIDCIPMGEICDSLVTLIVLNPETPDFVFQAFAPEKEALFDTRQVREALGGVSLAEPEVAAWIKESIDEEFKPILEVS